MMFWKRLGVTTVAILVYLVVVYAAIGLEHERWIRCSTLIALLCAQSLAIAYWESSTKKK